MNIGGHPHRPRLRHGRAATALASAAVVLLLAAQAALGAPAQAFPAGAYWYKSLDLPNAWKVTRGAGVTVAVIDSGVQASIADLRGQVLPGLDLSGDDPSAHHEIAIKGEGNYGHGTAMATLIAGTGRRGLTGVAPQAKILPIDADHAARQGHISAVNSEKAIRWAVDHHADIVSLSLGTPEPCTSADAAAVEYAYRHDVIVVAASGNDGGAQIASPADCPGALAVGAISASFRRWPGSNHGPELDFVAPGQNMIDELLDGTAAKPGSATSNGTSSSTAIVSGTLALLRAKFPHDSARQIVTRAINHVHSGLGAGSEGKRINDELGYGVILPRFALTEATSSSAPNPIYDRFAKELGPPTASGPSGSASRSASDPSTASSSSAATTSASDSNDSGFPIWIVLVIVLVVVVAVIVIFAVRARRNRARRGGPPQGWGGTPTWNG